MIVDRKQIKIILLVIALFYILAPHSIHMKVSPDWILMKQGFPHYYHIAFGFTLLIIAALL